MKIRPTAHRVLVKLKPIEREERSDAGIILTTEANHDARQRAMQEAYVIEVGPSAFNDFGDGEAWCKEGDLVMIAKYSGEDRVDPETNEVYRIINDEDIFAVVEEE